jgi:vacuolar-type H+-ATPase subunit I/STV1
LSDNLYGESTSAAVEATYYYKRLDHKCTYPFGIDPAWSLSKNRLIFGNGIKMKLSVIMGILHMSMGIIIKGTNAVYFKKIPVLIFEVCTGLIILLGLFGWMDVLIISKWFINVDIDDPTLHLGTAKPFKTDSNDPTEANLLNQTEGDYRNEKMPSIIGIMISTAFGFGEIKEKDENNFPLIGSTQKIQY